MSWKTKRKWKAWNLICFHILLLQFYGQKQLCMCVWFQAFIVQSRSNLLGNDLCVAKFLRKTFTVKWSFLTRSPSLTLFLTRCLFLARFLSFRLCLFFTRFLALFGYLWLSVSFSIPFSCLLLALKKFSFSIFLQAHFRSLKSTYFFRWGLWQLCVSFRKLCVQYTNSSQNWNEKCTENKI